MLTLATALSSLLCRDFHRTADTLMGRFIALEEATTSENWEEATELKAVPMPQQGLTSDAERQRTAHIQIRRVTLQSALATLQRQTPGPWGVGRGVAGHSPPPAAQATGPARRSLVADEMAVPQADPATVSRAGRSPTQLLPGISAGVSAPGDDGDAAAPFVVRRPWRRGSRGGSLRSSSQGSPDSVGSSQPPPAPRDGRRGSSQEGIGS